MVRSYSSTQEILLRLTQSLLNKTRSVRLIQLNTSSPILSWTVVFNQFKCKLILLLLIHWNQSVVRTGNYLYRNCCWRISLLRVWLCCVFVTIYSPMSGICCVKKGTSDIRETLTQYLKKAVSLKVRCYLLVRLESAILECLVVLLSSGLYCCTITCYTDYNVPRICTSVLS